MVRTLAKLAVTALLIWVTFRRIDLDLVVKNILLADKLAVAAAGVLTLLLTPLLAARWSYLITTIGFKLSFGMSFPIVWIGLFFSQVLPSAVGGDAVRIWLAYRAGITGSAALASVLIDRIIGVVAILVLLTVQLPALFYFGLDGATIAALVTIVIAGNIGVIVAASIDRGPRWIQSFRIGRHLASFSVEMRRAMLNFRRLLVPFAYSLANQIAVILCVAIIGFALRLDLDLASYFLVVPLANLVQVLPISLGGWGLREGFYVVAFAKLGIAAPDALALSVLYGLINMACSLPGGLIWLSYRTDRASGAREAEGVGLGADPDYIAPPTMQ
jgi:glycosyltransferase 2 family protein